MTELISILVSSVGDARRELPRGDDEEEFSNGRAAPFASLSPPSEGRRRRWTQFPAISRDAGWARAQLCPGPRGSAEAPLKDGARSLIVGTVDVAELIEQLSRKAAYAHVTDAVEVRQTHISVVFLAGEYAYKIKKPVDLGFLDFSTLEARRRDCHDEVTLNRRLAESVYLGVVPVVRTAEGLAFDGPGDALEWAVKMRRLSDDASLLKALDRDELDADRLRRLAERIAAFHASAARGPAISAFGKFDVVAGNARENFAQSAPEIGVTVSRPVYDELSLLTETALDDLRPLIERRAEGGVPCDGHGDLRLEHIYTFAAPPPQDLVIIDCLEYTERFRCADPVNDIAFTVMELVFAGRSDAARIFADAYFRAAGDDEGRELLPFYVAYRSVVRGKVRGFELREREIPAERRDKSLVRARAHFLLALGVLATPPKRPMLVLVGGLPGTGKSTLARGLAEHAGAELIRSDVVRKELAGLPAGDSAAASWQSGFYSDDWTRRTYEECQKRAERLLFDGKRVIVDASFGRDALRVDLLALAERCSVAATLFICDAPPELVHQRLAQRKGDASDADAAIYEAARRAWEPCGAMAQRAVVNVDARDAATALGQALAALKTRELA